MFKTIFILLLITSLQADKLFFLPDESKQVLKLYKKSILNAKNSIDIAMYNFSYKPIQRQLLKASKKGVKIDLIFDKKNEENKKSAYNKLCTKKNFSCYIVDSAKMHIKAILIDNEVAMFGSANFKEESFESNYELIYTTSKKKIINKIESGFKKLKLESSVR
ncbi:MAG: nuclease [Helicobacteraceae bacterium]|nr:nuclease [Helicobacteraceae bacterium]